MVFEVAKFLEDPKWEEFDQLRKSDLLKIATHYQAGLKYSMRKQEVKNEVIQILVDENLFEEGVLEEIVKLEDMSEAVHMKELELQFALQEKQLEIDAELRQKELEMKERLETEKLEIQKKELELSTNSNHQVGQI